MKIISTHTFKHTLRDIHKNTQNRKFCFVLGAGASVKSGIPTGGQLAVQWFKEIRDRIEEIEFGQWISGQKIDENDLASSYGSIYRKRFENDKTSGYEFLVQAMKSASPSFGHIVLAQILSRTSGHCVLTTNFDSLVESSVYQFTNKTPLVCGHESLSGYARPSETHPLVIKIHRDLLLEPKSDPDEIDKLDIGWKAPLDHIFSTHIPIIIGYGGNDGSLMNYFEKMNKPTNFFWCGLNENYLSKKVKALIEMHDGSFVQITGFDEFMHELLWVFDEIKPINEELNEITSERITIATKQLEEITTIIVDKITPNVISLNNRKIEISALEYSSLLETEPDLDKRKIIYLEALEKYPTTGWLWWKFTYFLNFVKRDFLNLDTYYQKALEFNKVEGAIFNNYAIYLKDVKRDYIQAEEYHLKAIAINPDDTNINTGYANFLYHIKKDCDKAEQYYLKALEIEPTHAICNSSYAQFLKNEKKDYNKAEEHYMKALTTNPDNANVNANYAQILLERSKTFEAEKYMLKAFTYKNDDDALIELWFYRFAHFPKFILEAEIKIEELLSIGIRSIGWDFSGNIREAIKNKHPKPEKLQEFALKISTE
ncbi:MAG: tetratricopeptide repeat protein [Sphingobacteriaceae bacterium]|nr:MAG: tetratricopeptide repeat protein [Sphingobacteriaceae bacterium]